MKFKVVSIAVSLAAVLAGGVFAPASAQVNDYTFGLRALQDGHLDAAILAFETYLKEHPKGPLRGGARFFLAEAKYEKGVAAEALRDYRAFLAEFPDHPLRDAAHFRVGRIELSNGRYRDAAAQFVAVKGGPFADQALYYLGHIQYHLEDWDGTVAVLSDLLRRYPASPWAARSRYALGMAHYKKKDDDAALRFLEAYRKAAKPAEAGYLWASAVVGEILRRRGRCGAAIGGFEAVLKGGPDFSGREMAIWGLAECLYQEENYAAAAKQYESYLAAYPDDSPRSLLARIRGGHSHLLSGRHKEALGLLRGLAGKEIPPAYRSWVLYWTARAQELSGEKDAALATYEELAARHPKSAQAADAAAKAATMRFERKEYEQALGHLSRLKGSPDPIQAVWAARMTAEAQFALGRYGEALVSFSEVLPKIQEKEARLETIRKLAVSAYRGKQDQDALQYLTAWLAEEREGRADGGDGRREALQMLAAVQMRLGLLRDLADTWGRLEDETPQGPDGAASHKAEFSANRGLVLFQLGRYEAAEGQFQKWLARYSQGRSRPEVLLHLGLSQLRTGKDAEAARNLDVFLKEVPAHARAREALYASALGHLRSRAHAKAAERLARWLEGAQGGREAEQVREVWFLLAGARFESADWKGAAAAYHEILKRYPEDGRQQAILQRLATAYDRLGEQEGSGEAVRRLEERYPDPKTRGRVSLLLGKERLLRKQWDKALHAFGLAAGSPEADVRAEGLYRLARLHAQQGRERAALEALERIPKAAQEKAEWGAEADYLRGVVYEGEKEWDRAVEAYRMAARRSQSPSLARAALDRIAKIESLRWSQ